MVMNAAGISARKENHSLSFVWIPLYIHVCEHYVGFVGKVSWINCFVFHVHMFLCMDAIW